jgi:glyoxylate reductase
MKVLYSDVFRNERAEKELGIEYADLKRVLKESDFVSVHVPLMPSTRHFIGEAELNLMKRSAILVNTSRGPVVDELALYKALKDGQMVATA